MRSFSLPMGSYVIHASVAKQMTREHRLQLNAARKDVTTQMLQLADRALRNPDEGLLGSEHRADEDDAA